MRIKVSKPVSGRVDLVLDDLRGATGMREYRTGVLVTEAGSVVSQLVDQWRQAKDAVKAARRLRAP